jgi:hypothetical protein
MDLNQVIVIFVCPLVFVRSESDCLVAEDAVATVVLDSVVNVDITVTIHVDYIVVVDILMVVVRPRDFITRVTSTAVNYLAQFFLRLTVCVVADNGAVFPVST